MSNSVLLVFTVLAVCAFHTTQGMKCTSSDSLIQLSCPIPLIGDDDKSYCCWSRNAIAPECCTLPNYVVNFVGVQYPAYFIGALIGATVVIVWLACCRR